MRHLARLTCALAYYSPILSGLTQKAKSGIVRQMWAEEPRKQLFTLLGQAYSELRDSNAARASTKTSSRTFCQRRLLFFLSFLLITISIPWAGCDVQVLTVRRRSREVAASFQLLMHPCAPTSQLQTLSITATRLASLLARPTSSAVQVTKTQVVRCLLLPRHPCLLISVASW